ncbi:MAG: response regulator [Deltaproteobacteria bacterium]|jgi:signal transduction histidine kinase/CheY-like chemotaxis protein|nr:response regulator [Deltaproteobacteria bacterium]
MSFKTAIKNDYKLIILVIMTFLIMSFASYSFMSRVVRRQIELYSKTEMEVYRNSLTSLSRACEVALLHASQVMTMGMDRGVKGEGYLDLVQRLTDAYSTQGDITEIFNSLVCYLDGFYIDAESMASVPATEMRTLSWYDGAFKQSNVAEMNDSRFFFHSTPFVDPDTGRAVISISKPISDGSGAIRGAIAMEFLLDPVIARVESLKREKGEVFALLADRNLRIVAHPNADDLGKLLTDIGGIGELVPNLPKSNDDMLIKRIWLGDKRYVAIFSRLENGWILGMFSPLSFYYQEASDTFPVILGIALFLATMLAVVLIRLSQAKARSEEANRLKTTSLARISHELRTPLNAIIGLSDLVRRNPASPKSVSYLEDIGSAGSSLLNLVNEILDFSKLESGKIELIENPYKTAKLINDVLAMVSIRLKDKPLLNFSSDINQDVPGVLLGDERSVRQILLNLLVNAVKYTHTGYVKFSLDFKWLDDSVIELIFTVEDTGVGIKDEDLEHLFDDFVRLGGRQAQKVEGTGLGLSIALTLCRLMDGDIEVESVFGQGSKFTATCRQAVLDPRPLGELPAKVDTFRADYRAPFMAPSLKVLIVDDVQTNLTVAEGLLEPYGMKLTTALSGHEAVELAKITPFDLLFVDQMMPGLDGSETLKLLRAISGHYLKAPIISLTANAVTGAREALLNQGFDDYISKPIDYDEMAILLAKWVPIEARVQAPDEGAGFVQSLDGFPSGDVAPSATPAVKPEPVGPVPLRPEPVETGDGGSRGSALAEAEILAALAIDGFEPRDGLRRCGGALAKYLRLLGTFLADAESIWGRLSGFGASQDPALLPDLAISVHALKGASANVGANKLSGQAAVLEAAAKNGDMGPFAEGGLARLGEELAKVTERILAALNLTKSHAPSGAKTGEKPSPGTLLEIRKALEERDVGQADRLIEELSSECDPETKDILAAASDQILMADYKAAIELLERI